MSTKYVILDNSKPQFMTLAVVSFIKLFDEEPRRKIVLDALRYAQEKKGLLIHGYVVMPSHVHLIARAAEGRILWAIIRDLKKYTSVQIVRSLQAETDERTRWPLQVFEAAARHLKNHKNFKVWKDGYHAKDVSKDLVFYQKLTYIHNNPVKARLVQNPEDFEFSSARNYIGKSSPLEVISI